MTEKSAENRPFYGVAFDENGQGTTGTEDVNVYYPELPYHKKLCTEESPKQILSEDFPKEEWPISGGWGYSMEDAVKIELDKQCLAVSFEYMFVKYRCYEECIIFKRGNEKFEKIEFKTLRQSLMFGPDGKPYDHLLVEVKAMKKGDFLALREDLENHKNGFVEYLKKMEQKRFTFVTECYFDISRFFGK